MRRIFKPAALLPRTNSMMIRLKRVTSGQSDMPASYLTVLLGKENFQLHSYSGFADDF